MHISGPPSRSQPPGVFCAPRVVRGSTVYWGRVVAFGGTAVQHPQLVASRALEGVAHPELEREVLPRVAALEGNPVFFSTGRLAIGWVVEANAKVQA